MITNGIWYLGLYIGICLNCGWLIGVCSGYIAWLYTPWACEKVLILPVSLWLCKVMFKKDLRTQEQIRNLLSQAKEDWQTIKNKIRSKK